MKYKNKTIMQTRGSKTWYTRYRYDGKQYYLSGKTQQEVYNKLKLALKNVSIEEDIKNYTLKYWIDKWKRLYKINLRERSINELDYYISKISTTLLKKQMKFITSIELADFIHSLNGDRQKQKMYTIVNDIFDKAVKNEVITRNPLVVVEKPKYKSNERYSLTLTEENKLCEKIKGNEEYFIYALCMLQGLRPGEAFALEYKDVDFKNMTISITKSIDEATSDTQVKNKYGYRTIPLFKKTYEIIKDIDTTSSTRFAKHSVNVTNDKLKELIKDITKERITLYNLRHTFITRLSDKNVPEHIIQSWAGHQIGSKVTKTVYTHLSKETENKYIDILNN